LALSGVVLGAWYMLWLVQRVFFGPLRETPHEDGHEPVRDMSWREVFSLLPLTVFVLWIGLQPNYFLKPMSPTLNQLTQGVAVPLQERTESRMAAGSPSPQPAPTGSGSKTEVEALVR
jgi:NADH-quinone oxidoreductase subunit M